MSDRTDRSATSFEAPPSPPDPSSGTVRNSFANVEPNVTVGFTFLAVWVATGLAIAVLMRRRGHDITHLVAIGLVLGPLLLPLVRRRDVAVPSYVLATGRPSDGDFDLAVAVESASEGTVRAAAAVLDLIGPRAGDVTLVAAVDFETIDREAWDDAKGPAAIELELAAMLLRDRCEPGLVLVGGVSGYAQVRWATEHGYAAVVVGWKHSRLPRPHGRAPLVIVAPER